LRKRIARYLLIISCILATKSFGSDNSWIGFYLGSSLGYASIWNFDFGLNHKRKFYFDAEGGLFTYPEYHTKNIFSVTYKMGGYLFGPCLLNVPGSKSINNPGIALAYDLLDSGIKLRAQLVLVYPLTSFRLEDIVNIRVKGLLFEW
jgi:hypothetical protein